jgi:serine/threonine-protein kinase
MNNCPSCGAAADDAARYCLECGHAFEAAAEPGDPWQGREIAGRYRLVRKLGEGGMGEVYVAEQLAMDRLVALKLLREGLADDPNTVERFKREARAASRLSHPNTIILHDFGVDHDGTFYLAMELLEGETLAEVLRREKRLRPERAMAMLVQICGSLEEAHAQGVVHRDLKPENIFLTRRGGHPDFVKVLDFGIAKVRARAADAPVETITRAGMIFGTPQYMSPEQIRGDELDARSDVYALGVMLYQMISGHLPFQAGTPVEMLTKHLHATPQPIGDVDAAHRAAVARLEAVALRALSKDPDHRPSSAREFQEDLMAAVPQFSTAPMTGPVFATPVASAPVDAIEAP